MKLLILKRVFFCWVYVKLPKGKVFCCSYMDIKLWQVSSSPVSLKRFSYLCNLPSLSFLLPSLHPPTPSGDAVPYSQVQGHALYNSPLPKPCCFNYPLLSTSYNKQCCFGLCQTNQPTLPSPLAACHASLSTRGTAQPDHRLTSASSSARLSHNVFAALHVSDPFSFVWQMLWIVLSQKSEGIESTWLSKFSQILLFWTISRDYSREKLEGTVDSIISCRVYCPLYFPHTLPLTYFTSHLLLLLRIHSQGLCPDHNPLSSGLS